jgi:hypothetical protein
VTNDEFHVRRRELDGLCARLAVEKNDEEADRLLADVRLSLPSAHLRQLAQLINSGPVRDGDVIAKADRDDLIKWRLAARVMVMGEWGYTAATYLGGHVLDDRVEIVS